MDSSEVWAGRLFALRVFGWLALCASLPLTWYRLFGSTTTGWQAIGWSIPVLLLLVVVAGAIRARIRRTWLARTMAGVEVFAGLFLALYFEIAIGLFISPTDHRPAFYVAESAVWLAPLLALLQEFLHRRAEERSARGSTRPMEETEHPPPLKTATGPGRTESTSRPHAKELVLIIHGTGSAWPGDAGAVWWQVGGGFARELESRLPGHLRVHRTKQSVGSAEVFHWSGRNRESDRRAAGLELAKHLQRLTPRWHKIHLVAHSHGGSVVWHALREWVSAGREVSRVGTVVTLGTPFLRVAPGDTVFFALGLLALFGGFFWSIRAALVDAWVVGIEAWWQVKSLPVGLVLLAVLAVSLACVAELVRVAVSTFRWRRERKRDREVWQRLGERICCVHSSNDEAINGLATVIAAEGGLILEPDRPGSGRSVWHEPVLTLYEDIVGPILDQAVWRRTSRRLQGLDLGGTRFVGSSPLPLDGAESFVLRPEVSDRLDRWVSDHSTEALGRVRASLGVFWASGISVREIGRAIHKELVGKELVHWSYYQVPELIHGVGRLILNPDDRSIAERKTFPSTRTSRPQKAIIGNRFASRGRWASTLSVAAVLSVLSALVSSSWWRVAVYPLTDRLQVVAAIRDAPVEETLQAKELDPLARWLYARDRVSIDRSGTAIDLLEVEAKVPGSTEYLLVSHSLATEVAPRFFAMCEALYDVALGRSRPKRVIDLVESAFSSKERKPLAGYVSEAGVAELAANLHSEGAAFLRSCTRFRPRGAFFLEPERRYPAPWLGKREDDQDNMVGAALYLARAWGGDDSFLDEIEFSLTDHNDEALRGHGVRAQRAVQDKLERAGAWAPADLIAALLAYETPRARVLAEKVLHREFREEQPRLDFVGRELCPHGGEEWLHALEASLPSDALELLKKALNKCRIPTTEELVAARNNVELQSDAGLENVHEDLRLLAEHPTIEVDATTLRRLLGPPERDSRRDSTLLSYALALLARAGGVREARIRSEVCAPADRLRVLTEVVLRFRREHPGVPLSDVISEGDRVSPGF